MYNMYNWKQKIIVQILLTAAVLAMRVTTSNAAIGSTRISRGSINCISIVSGLGKVIDDSDAYGCQLDLLRIAVRCINSGGQSSRPENHVFNRDVPVAALSFGTSFFVDARGRAEATATVTDNQIEEALTGVEIECQNSNWTADLTTAVVNLFDATVYQFDCSKYEGDATALDLDGLIDACSTKDTLFLNCSGTPDIGDDYKCVEP